MVDLRWGQLLLQARRAVDGGERRSIVDGPVARKDGADVARAAVCEARVRTAAIRELCAGAGRFFVLELERTRLAGVGDDLGVGEGLAGGEVGEGGHGGAGCRALARGSWGIEG